MISENIPPIIVLGMHRSGTSLLSELLTQMGIFMGADWEDNKESKFFLEINEWLLKQAGVCWQEPQSFNYISEDFKSLMAEILKNRISTNQRFRYLGKYKSYKNLGELDFPWGWKDPRNTFTWKIWNEIYPQAKLIHLHRNPVDVIVSLNKREAEFFSVVGNRTRTGLKKKFLGYFLPHKRIFFHSFRASNMQGSFEMWKDYVSTALSVSENYQVRIMHIGYEDLVEKPVEIMTRIESFLGLKFDGEHKKRIPKIINPKRRYAFLGNDEYETFYNEIKDDPVVTRLGYNNIG
ncbi:MAG: sulfotransferase [Bacteroidales bacterium]|nr:sulfotransferase [Bacteroidales bacterium]MCF8405858.1 sulfotransferase [Bacteroidales bacterium]